MKQTKWGIIYCPREGSLRTRKRWKRIENALRNMGVAYDFVQSEGPNSVERLAKMMALNGYGTLIVVGGDAALNDALNGIMSEEVPASARPALGIIPNGFGNDFARYWGFHEDEYKETIVQLAHRRLRKIDIGEVAYLTKEGESKKKYFLNGINIGVAASIINLRRKTRAFWGLRTLSYLTSAVLLLFKRMDFDVEFVVNTEHIRHRVMTIGAGSAHNYGQTPSAIPYNGQLDVVSVAKPQLTQMFHGMWLLLTGRFLTHRGTKIWRTKHLRFDKTSDAPVCLDGHGLKDEAQSIEIKVLPEEINFIIPQ